MANTPSLSLQIKEDMIHSMREKNKTRLAAIRLILAAVKQEEVDTRKEVTNEGMLILLDKMLKQRRESLQQYLAADRQDLADKEAFEISVIQDYLPTPLSAEDLQNVIEKTIASVQATSMKDMGKVMAKLKPQVQGRADMTAVSQHIKRLLTGA